MHLNEKTGNHGVGTPVDWLSSLALLGTDVVVNPILHIPGMDLLTKM
jgi:hypothetical protein